LHKLLRGIDKEGRGKREEGRRKRKEERGKRILLLVLQLSSAPILVNLLYPTPGCTTQLKRNPM